MNQEQFQNFMIAFCVYLFISFGILISIMIKMNKKYGYIPLKFAFYLVFWLILSLLFAPIYSKFI